MSKAHWASDWKVGIRVWVEREGQAVLGEGRAELLAAIDTEHSITKAAKAAGMSYRRAWMMIQEVNQAAGETLVEAAVGGKQGGGARLMPHGRLALEVYDRVRQSLVESAAGVLQQSIKPDLEAGGCIHVAAAISLQEAVGQLLAEYALRQPTVRVRVIYGASNELADHLLAGAPGDLFISAELTELDRLEAAKLLVKGSRQIVAKNGLAFVGVPTATAVKKPADLLGRQFKRVALAEPACPLGQYSKVYLEKAGVYEKLLPRVLHVDNSRAVLAAVVSGAAQAGVVFSSDASGPGTWQRLLSVPTSQAAATYAAAILDHGNERPDAKSLLEFLTSPIASRCYRRCGFLPTSKPAGAARRKAASARPIQSAS
jgi:molybdate transport system substrate-binding protein